MKTDSRQSYQYRGIDLYGARCGIVHRYGCESELSEAGQCRIFVYSPKDLEHIYNSSVNPNMVIISIQCFINDFFRAVEEFLKNIFKDINLKSKTDIKIPKLFRITVRQ